MNDLILNLKDNATRQFIFLELKKHLDEPSRALLEKNLEQAGVSMVHHHSLAVVEDAIKNLKVSDRVKQDARAIYTILATAEAQVHACEISQTHFHEVGNGEAIYNTIGICLAIEMISPDRILASPVQTGKGEVQCAHGTLDIPAPATAAILEQGIPMCSTKHKGELCTPTSAAIILHFVDEFIDE